MPTTFELAVSQEELSLDRCLRTGMVFRWKQVDGGWEGVDGPFWYRLRHEGDCLKAESNATRDDLIRFLRLDWPTAETHAEITRRGPELLPYIEAAQGLRVIRYADPVETIFSFLCSANNHVGRIGQMVEKLAAYGDVIPGTQFRKFPSVERIAQVSEQELRAAGFGYRGASIPKVALLLVARGGDEYVAGLKEVGHQKAKEELVSLPSIGPKLADCICLFGLGYDAVVPVDTHLWQAATRLYFPQYRDTALSSQKYEEFATFFISRFGELSGWAHQTLFFDNLLNWRSRKSASNRQ